MPTIKGKEYPRLENGVVVYGPKAERATETPTPKPAGPNINTATATELSKGIKGVGPANARDIVAHRKKRPFVSLIDCADRVGGVSVEQLEAAGAVV